MLNLSSYFQSVRDRVADIPRQFQLSNCLSLIIVQRRSGGQTTYLEIEPRPIIQTVSPNLAQAYEGVEGIQIELDDLQTQISRKYDRDQIVGKGISYLINAQLINGKPVGGIAADKVPNTVIQEKDLHWELILRRRP